MTALPSNVEALYEQAPCGLLLSDADGLILRANATLCNWLGYGVDELVGHVRVQDLFTVGARLFHHTHCQPILEMNGSVAELQVELRGSTGTLLPMLINVIRRRGPPVVDEWALFLASERRSYERLLLGARRAAEEALEARRGAEAKLQALNAELSAADRRKDEFLATLSHELRNPLAPLRTGLDILKLKLAREPATERLLSAFDRQLHHLTHLVDDLMDISRINQGRMHLRRSPIELTSLLRTAAHDVTEMMTRARHSFAVSLPSTPIVVDADATRLVQVVVNLLTNAAKYTPDGGTISLYASREGDDAVVRVRDNGIGLSPHALTTVFNMFSQLEPALERANGGLGIGLALVRGIVELHGGSIHAESEGEGKGSTFTVRLPLARLAVCSAGPRPTSAPRSQARVLVVDDNADAAETLVMALELHGCEVRVAYRAMDALALAARFQPHAGLLDIGLPDMNGYELARRLRTIPGCEGMTLIAATGWGQDKDRQRAFDAGFNHHMTKPVDMDLLRRLLPCGKDASAGQPS